MRGDIETLIQAGAIFLAYMFMAIVIFAIFSSPVEALMDGFMGMDVGSQLASDKMSQFIPLLKTAVQVAFAFGLAAPVTWFIFWIFSREPSIERYRRY